MLDALQERYGAALDHFLREMSGQLPADAPQLAQMADYALGLVDECGRPERGSRGKRLRPTLLLLVNEAAGGEWRAAVPAAAAVELLHNFSLVHDDIQDDSPLRRGRPSVWRVWGRPQGINAGDLLFTLSFAALTGLADRGISAKVQLVALDSLLSACRELTRGQHLDLHFETCDVVEMDRYLSMIRGKSAALISTCSQIGALVAGACDPRTAHFAQFGMSLGMAFQIRDDYLGIWGEPSLTGKSSATDIRSRKKTMPVLYGIQTSPRFAKLYRRPAHRDEDIQTFLSLLEDAGAKDYVQEQETHWTLRAREALNAARPEAHAASLLQGLMDELLRREL